MDGGGMHWLDVGGILGGDPVLLKEDGKLSWESTLEIQDIFDPKQKKQKRF